MATDTARCMELGSEAFIHTGRNLKGVPVSSEELPAPVPAMLSLANVLPPTDLGLYRLKGRSSTAGSRHRQVAASSLCVADIKI